MRAPFCTRLGEKGGDESSAAPHGSVGEGDGDDSPSDGINSGDSTIAGVSETPWPAPPAAPPLEPD